MTPFEILHPALHALPDVVIAVDPTTIRVLDVNRSEAFGRARDTLTAMELDDLIDVPRAELERFVMAADGHSMDVGVVAAKGGTAVHATARAATSAAAATRPCVIVVVRETPEHARVLEEVARLQTIVEDASRALERIAGARRAAPVETEIDDSAIVEEVPPPWIPELSLAQYASFCVEHELNPVNARETDARYGLPTEASRAELHRVWTERLRSDVALGAQFKTLSAQYSDWYLAQQRAREATVTHASGIVAFSAPAPVQTPQTPAPPPSQTHAAPPSSQTPAPSQAAPTSQASDALDGRKAQRTTAPAAPDPRVAPLPWSGTDSASIAIAHAREHAAAVEISEPPSLNVRATIGVNEALAQGQALPFKPEAPPDLTVEQFAALGVELEAYPDRRLDVLSMYGISTDTAWKACDAIWTARFVADAALRQKWLKLSNDLRGKLVRK